MPEWVQKFIEWNGGWALEPCPWISLDIMSDKHEAGCWGDHVVPLLYVCLPRTILDCTLVYSLNHLISYHYYIIKLIMNSRSQLESRHYFTRFSADWCMYYRKVDRRSLGTVRLIIFIILYHYNLKYNSKWHQKWQSII